ncbi:Stp1/IreP family PP2C-type Ser/Thr phosphatase [Verminephrobacter aporrectodeae subsp. tuberculatae]|uniref:Stp1/IreP family PP2C-type Ser/Thr phosphatase n=3 Tax=Verminephrobacter TaxID=364316 RepID=A0ABT3KVF7_9BURK|nr:Stp1/IreP family PP2C-type Ser/Thr phosphatase [Verminephrobacter aporrectodeae subsp. tuberculatae]MCW5288733.1 Stp1/IreP family PP2C-type Ser/Thr phosphatase [Verminephrobacter aporrectodeae subsp. tuberculatae]MCW5322320.1 Stp1/IreP family PP2C-type Ser/Thr phosphatase [Verminephrobacter aporrectodeae subsp. tuberculatae]MCW8166130.1 Stp1/IreP family PP2C-type Ser/Thr phosphatase [Verminephrobacter aporrectodeae subsp. tuberculatae]MCW8170417.1 Stp1/IreP family PP2C-type Ser/Thr phosphata
MAPAPTSMTYEFFARTDQGRVRPNNEDAVAIDHGTQIAILADGMGGYNAGEVASAMATDFIRTEMVCWLTQAGASPPSSEVRQVLECCVERANHAIWDASRATPRYAGMGTTLVVAVFHGNRLTLGHIGDSRCYRLRAGALQQITRDHSWIQEQIDAGLLTPRQATFSTQRNLVTRALGVGPSAMMEVNEFQVAPDDLFLLCTDGLTDMVPDADLAHMLRAPLALEEKTARLIDSANAHGGRDNVSVLLVQAGKRQGLHNHAPHPE